MKLGTENKKKTMIAAALGALAVIVFFYELLPVFSGSSPTVTANSHSFAASAPVSTRTSAAPRRHTRPSNSGTATGHKKVAEGADNLDPTLQLQLLAASEDTKYEGSGRNIFVSQEEMPVDIPRPKAPGVTDGPVAIHTAPPIPPPTPIPLKFFGFASQPGEPKKIFLAEGDDVFIAGEGEIVDRRYKVLRISPTSVELQDLVNSTPPQNIPLTQG